MRPSKFDDIIPQEEQKQTLELINKISAGEEIKSLKTRRKTKHGRILDIWLTVTMIADAAGQAIHIATTERDQALLRTSIRLGILGKERFQYRYLMTWTLVRKPRLIPLTITLAIYGHHFRRICEKHIL